MESVNESKKSSGADTKTPPLAGDFEAITLTVHRGVEKPQMSSFDNNHEGTLCLRTVGDFDYITVVPEQTADKNNCETLRSALNTAFKFSTMGNSESKHNLLLIRYPANHIEDENDRNFYNSFSWDKDIAKNYPFLFVSLIHLNKPGAKNISGSFITSQDKDNFVKSLLSNNFRDYNNPANPDGTPQYFVTVYYSVDCCDLVLFMRTQRYRNGFKKTEYMLKSPYVRYTYSMCGFEDNVYKFPRTSVEKLTLCGVVNNRDIFLNWLNELNAQIDEEKKRSEYNGLPENKMPNLLEHRRIGNEGAVLNFLNFRGEWILGHIIKIDGLLSNENENYKKAFFRPRIHFDLNSDLQSTTTSQLPPPTPLQGFRVYFDKIKSEVENTNDHRIQKQSQKALSLLLNACDQLFSHYFVPSIYDCFTSVFPVFYEKINAYFKENNKENKVVHIEFNKELQKFIRGWMSFFNGAIQADKVFFQIPGFNATLYDAPAKLLHFYTAFMQLVAQALDDNSKRAFRFMLSLDIHARTTTTLLIDYSLIGSSKERDHCLPLVNMPVDMLFKPERLLLELTHEVTHIVGKKLRCREKRYDHMFEMLCAILKRDLFEGIIELTPKNHNDINQLIKDSTQELFNSFHEKYNDDNMYYSNYTNELLFQIFAGAIENRDIIWTHMFRDNLKDTGDTKSHEAFQQMLKADKRARDFLDRNLHLDYVSYHIAPLVKESFADLIMLLVLNDTSNKSIMYKQLTAYAFYLFRLEQCYAFNPVGARIYSVIKAMGYNAEKLLAYYKKYCEEINREHETTSKYKQNNSKDEQDSFREFLCGLNYYEKSDKEMRTYIDEIFESAPRLKNAKDKKDKLDLAYRGAFPKRGIQANIKYLQCCKKEFEKKNNCNYFGKIRKIYQGTVNGNIQDFAANIFDASQWFHKNTKKYFGKFTSTNNLEHID